MIKNVQTEEEFQGIVDNEEGLILVKFSAPWCAPCKTLDPILEEVDQDTDVTILKVNVDELPQLAGEFRVMSIPTTFFIQGKEALTVLNGAGSKETILSIIKEIKEPQAV